MLEPRRPYLIPLRESLDLPPDLAGFVNPKSSAGRVDTLCRALTDRSDSFDQIRRGYRGPLYVEVVSRTFPLLIRPDMTLVQLRLFDNNPGLATDGELREVHRTVGLVHDPSTGKKVPMPITDEGLGLTLDLRGDENGVVGYRAKRNTEVLDFDQRDQQWQRFWEPVYRDVDHERLVLEPEEFYLLLSREAITIPPDLAAEMVPYDVRSGEVRTHYAGFFDPGFGFDTSSGWGTKGRSGGSQATLEVRGPRRALRGRAGPAGVLDDLLEDDGGARVPLRRRDRVQLPGPDQHALEALHPAGHPAPHRPGQPLRDGLISLRRTCGCPPCGGPRCPRRAGRRQSTTSPMKKVWPPQSTAWRTAQST